MDAFTKRVIVEKHINGIMYENPGGHASPPCSLCRRPCHSLLIFETTSSAKDIN